VEVTRNEETQDDWERRAAADPRTHPQQLADLANRRWDLHAVIAANPGAFPELRRWIAAVNPSSLRPQPPYAPGAIPSAASGARGYEPSGYAPSAYSPAARGRRGGAGWWLAGCGCLLVLGGLVLGLVLLWAAFAAPSGHGAAGRGAAGAESAETREDGSSSEDPEAAEASAVAEQLEIFEGERAKYAELLAQLDGNPVAPLVVFSDEQMILLEERARDPELDEFGARSLAFQAAQYREDLEQTLAEAADRRESHDGSLTERLVVRETNGFVEVLRDAESACGEPEEGTITTGCVFGADPLTIHLLPESGLESDWEREMLVIHELAHVYQHADVDGFGEELVARGLFQGSDEKMADCYALTYYDRWELSNGGQSVGYDYVCDESERQAIREWAAKIDAPMPG